MTDRRTEAEPALASSHGYLEAPAGRSGITLTDLHAHLAVLSGEQKADLSCEKTVRLALAELDFRSRCGIGTFFSAGTPEEWAFMKKVAALAGRETSEKTAESGRGEAPEKTAESGRREAPEKIAESGRRERPDQRKLYFSFGIHPWYADQYEPGDYLPYYQDCAAIGEIGMDSVWCGLSLSLQRRQLERQLQIAADLKKPVVLHTKGCEAEIAEILRGFPGKALVHWYSGDEKSLEAFLEQDCYFTLGPDTAMWLSEEKMFRPEPDKSGLAVHENLPIVSTPVSESAKDARTAETPGSHNPERSVQSALCRRMLQEIPADRLFFETDGLPAVEWAFGRSVSWEELAEILQVNLALAARAKQCSAEALAALMQINLQRFLAAS